MNRLFSILLALAPSLALAEAPTRVAYQGRLLKSDGTPLSGPLQVRFSLYVDAATTTALWTEEQVLAFSDGYYATILGDVNPLPASALDGKDIYMEIAIADSPLSPRQRIVSVPYAMAATNVLGGVVNATSLQVVGVAPKPGVGTVTGFASGDTMTLTGTNTILQSQISPGDIIVVATNGGAVSRLVTSVSSNTSLTVQSPFTTNFTNANFTIQKPIAQMNVHDAEKPAGSPGMLVNALGDVGIGTATPKAKLDIKGDAAVDGTVRARNLNALVASEKAYTWKQLSESSGVCPAGYHFAVALEALVRCYLDSASCRRLGSENLWVSGNHDAKGCSRNLLSHSGTDCWGGEGVSVAGIPTTKEGYHWIVHSPGSYAGALGPSLGAAKDTDSLRALCVPNFQ